MKLMTQSHRLCTPKVWTPYVKPRRFIWNHYLVYAPSVTLPVICKITIMLKNKKKPSHHLPKKTVAK
jgi:hypothetical protein